MQYSLWREYEEPLADKLIKEKIIGFIDRATEIMKKHEIYRSGHGNRYKSIGFIDWATESIEKALVL